MGSVGDDPHEGVLHEHLLSFTEGKSIVVASDGLWDNYDVTNIQKDILDNGDDYGKMAKKIAESSYKCSLQ